MKYYIAGRYDRREELAGYAEELREKGHTVDCRWLLGLHQIHANAEKVDVDKHPEHGVTLEARPFAQDDYDDVKAVDVLVFFSEPPETYSKRGGRHVEFGMALAWGKQLVVIGRRENVFHCLPQVKRYDTWTEFLLATPPTKGEGVKRMEYRKKPVVIEAIQYTDKSTPEVVKFIGDTRHTFTYNEKGMAMYLDTLEGGHTASQGDWIIKGVKGEFYPCKPDIFEQTYELATALIPASELREEVAKTIRDHGVFYVEFKPNKVKIERDIGRLTSELLSLFQSAQADVVRQRAELLKKAVELIKTWHNGEAVIKLGQEQADYMWDIYYNHAPEMKEIREALSEG